MVSTVFIHRREAHLSSALRAFLEHARTASGTPAIVSSDTGNLIKPLAIAARA
jgi:hypothetical protein